jgi:hypothetical protein
MFQSLSDALVTSIFQYACPHTYQLHPDVPLYTILGIPQLYANERATSLVLHHINWIQWAYFSDNPSTEAVTYLIQHPHRIHWVRFSKNPHELAIRYCIAHPDKMVWRSFCTHTHPLALVHILTHRPDDMNWTHMSAQNNDTIVSWLLDHYPHRIKPTCNPHPRMVQYLVDQFLVPWRDWSVQPHDTILDVLFQNPLCIWHTALAANPSDRATAYMLESIHRIRWNSFSKNSNDQAVAYLLAHPQHIDPVWFSGNTHKKAIDYMMAHPDKINWIMFSQHRSDQIVPFCMMHQDQIDWGHIALNPGLFVMAEDKTAIHEWGKCVVHG